ncbi:hypothetical protein [Agrobacterium sp. NPDC090283]|uniref:hypothetical protein n=1 Tax=Agrobacterium sp. NPDC090283 TaxID=3363920 RepID=UPI00383AEA17
MSNEDIVADHLKAALLATNTDKPFLAYLIQMALIETRGAWKDLQLPDSVDQPVDEIQHYDSASEFLSRLPLSQHRARMKTSFL